MYQCLNDDNGKLLALGIKKWMIKDSSMYLRPNEDTPIFYQTLTDKITRNKDEEIIITSDYNIVIDRS